MHREPGGSLVAARIPQGSVSAFNWCEVVQKAVSRGIGIAILRQLLDAGLRIEPFSLDDAERTAALWQPAPQLSLADRACLALAQRLDLPAITGDRAWGDLALGV